MALWVAAGVASLYLACELYLFSGELGFPLDDGWIHLQFARQLAAGQGLAFNPGRWVAGSTAPLWTALLSLGFIASAGFAVAWAKLLGVVFFLATVALAGALSDRLSPGRGPLAAILVAVTPWLVWASLSGMETLCFTALGLLGMLRHLDERARPSARPLALAVLALAALARPEGLLLLALAVLDGVLGFERDAEMRLVIRWRSDPRRFDAVLRAALVLVPAAVVYRVLGGSFLPTTFAVKSSLPASLLPSSHHLARVLDVLFASQPWMLALAGAGVVGLVRRLGTERDRGLLPALWLLALPLANAWLAAGGAAAGVGNFGRYYFPLLPVVVVLGVAGLEPLLAQLGRRARRAVVAVVFLPQLVGLFGGPLAYTQSLANVADSDLAAARWLAPRLPGDARLAVQDIGALKYHLPNPVIDLTGIVNPELLDVLRSPDAGAPTGWEERLLGYLERERPDYLVVFTERYPRITGATPGFAKVRVFRVERNVTMAGDTLAVVSTPWTRHRLREPG